MFINKISLDFYQLFSGIDENKLFLQIVTRQGEVKYFFESKELDMSSNKTICFGIMESSYEFFDPKNFCFDEDFVLSTQEPLLIRRYGEKMVIETKEIKKCTSFEDLHLSAMESFLFIESFLPFEKPLEKPKESNIDHLLANSPKWI